MEIPICGFETIAERTKSANKRQSKPPMRFSNEYEYFPKMNIKKEKINQEYTGNGIVARRRPGRPRVMKTEVKGQVADESSTCVDVNNYFSYRIRDSSLTSSTPKVKTYTCKMGAMDPVLSSPPRLVAMRAESQSSQPLSAVDTPPILHPIKPFKKYHTDLKTFSESENNMNDINGTKEDCIIFDRMKREIFDLKRRHDLVVEQLAKQRAIDQQMRQEMDKLRADKGQLELDKNRYQASVVSLKQKLAEQSDFFERELRNTKQRHWCTVCLQEAKYYCCWLGSYCSENCQNIHWKGSHKKYCRRQSN